MSLIIARKHPDTGCFSLFADKQVNNGDERFHTPVSKIWSRYDRLMGYVGYTKLLQILKKEKWKHDSPSVYYHAIDVIAPRAIDLAIQNHVTECHEIEGEMLIAEGDQLVLIQNNGCVIDISDVEYYAIGSGRDYAMGALYLGADMGRVFEAVNYHCTSVGKEFEILKI